MIAECEVNLEKLHTKKSNVENNLHNSTAKFSDEIRQQTKRRITLELLSIPYEDDQLTEQQLINRENTEQWFFRDNVTRDQATEMFEACRSHLTLPNGTFLVRSSSDGGYAISVW